MNLFLEKNEDMLRRPCGRIYLLRLKIFSVLSNYALVLREPVAVRLYLEYCVFIIGNAPLVFDMCTNQSNYTKDLT